MMLMDWAKILVDNGLHYILLGVFVFIGWVFKKAFMEPIHQNTLQIEKINAKIDGHIIECNRIPKQVIVERIADLKEDIQELKVIFRGNSN